MKSSLSLCLLSKNPRINLPAIRMARLKIWKFESQLELGSIPSLTYFIEYFTHFLISLAMNWLHLEFPQNLKEKIIDILIERT